MPQSMFTLKRKKRAFHHKSNKNKRNAKKKDKEKEIYWIESF